MAIDPTLTAPNVSPADWCTADDVLALPDTASLDPALITFGIQLASRVLWSASARQIGLFERKWRPTAGDCSACGWSFVPTGDGSWWRYTGVNVVTGVPRCGCDTSQAWLSLPGPVAAVEAVWIDGVEHTPDEFGIQRNRRGILWLDSSLSWPACNDMFRDPETTTPQGDPQAWLVHYWRGRNIPPDGVTAAAILARDIASSLCGGACSDAVKRATKITRQGVSFDFEKESDLRKAATAGATGLRVVDLWVKSVNPYGRTRPARVWRADDPRRNQRAFGIAADLAVLP